MAARPYWRGQIRLALVSIPVDIYTATRAGAHIAFRQIHEPTGKPIHYEKVVEGRAVDEEDIRKGYEIDKGEYVLLDQDEIDAVKLESRRTLELTQFVDAGEIDVLYFDKPYFVVPADPLAEQAYGVLRDAMRRSRKVGLGQLAMRGREYIVALKPCGRGMILETLRYADEVEQAGGFFRDIPEGRAEPELLDMAEALIEAKSAPFQADRFKDRYRDALRALVDRKQRAHGAKIIEDPDDAAPRRGDVVDLMAALKKSIGAPLRPAGSSRPRKSSARKRA